MSYKFRKPGRADADKTRDLIAWCLRRGYHLAKPGGHTYEKTTMDHHYLAGKPVQSMERTVRYNFTPLALRKEVLCWQKEYDGRMTKHWVRLASNYISALSINEKDQICGLKTGGKGVHN
jgi:hypothetical protein